MTDEERKARAKTKREAASAAGQQRAAVLRAQAGKDLSTAARVHWKTANFTDFPAAVAALREGITVTNYCVVRDTGGQQMRRGTSTRHKMRFNPDGSVTLVDHPGHVLDVDAELMLAALGGDAMLPCIAAAIYYPISGLITGKVVGSATMNKQLRALHTAVAWAQVLDHEWTADFGDTHLRYGITPTMVATWEADGWDPDKALMFQQQFASLEVANAWREAGQISQRAASLAGRGEYPNEEARWARVGFTASKSKKWRGKGHTPEQAWEWEQHKIPPTAVDWLIGADARGDIALDTAKEWSKGGVPTKDLLGWYRATNANLSTAVFWTPARIKPADLQAFTTWNYHRPKTKLTPQVVGTYTKVGAPRLPEPIARAVAAGVTPNDFKDTIAALADNNHPTLLAALTTEATRRTDDYTFSWFAADSDPSMRGWVVRDIRNGYSQEVSGFILNWLIAHHRPVRVSRA